VPLIKALSQWHKDLSQWLAEIRSEWNDDELPPNLQAIEILGYGWVGEKGLNDRVISVMIDLLERNLKAEGQSATISIDVSQYSEKVGFAPWLRQRHYGLQCLFTGYRGHLDFVDDNFIGNKKAVKAVLPHLIAWQKAHGYPFEFSTEASINLADDAALLALMCEANFLNIFVGIESPDPETLVSTQKKQNTRRVLDDSVRKIYRAGIFVHAGFIVGFDSEKDGVAAGMTDFIEAAAIPVCMVGLLFALPHTQLGRRLEKEGRMRHKRSCHRDRRSENDARLRKAFTALKRCGGLFDARDRHGI
jgi:hypothetical protein